MHLRSKSRTLAIRVPLMLALLVGIVGLGTPAHASNGFDGTYRLFNEGSTGCMLAQGATPGTKVVKWALCWDADYPDQHWESSSVGNGAYQLRNQNSGLCLAVPNKSINVSAIQTTCNGSTSQQWDELDANKPDYGDRMLQNRYSGLCLISQAGTTTVVQWYCVSSYRDQWWYFY